MQLQSCLGPDALNYPRKQYADWAKRERQSPEKAQEELVCGRSCPVTIRFHKLESVEPMKHTVRNCSRWHVGGSLICTMSTTPMVLYRLWNATDTMCKLLYAAAHLLRVAFAGLEGFLVSLRESVRWFLKLLKLQQCLIAAR